MDPKLINILLLSLVGSIAGLAGGVFFLLNKKFAKVLCKFAVPFAAGVLLGASLLHLLPEAVEHLGQTGYMVTLIALLSSFLFEQYLANLHHHEETEHTLEHHATIPLVIFGDTIHNFIDGVAIAAAYLANPAFGLVIALATFLHETPHEIGDFGVIVSMGWTRKKTFWANFLSALATFPGALFVYFIARDATNIIGILLGVSAGIFLYLGASDFLPEVRKSKKGILPWKKFTLLIAGVLIMYLITRLPIVHNH